MCFRGATLSLTTGSQTLEHTSYYQHTHLVGACHAHAQQGTFSWQAGYAKCTSQQHHNKHGMPQVGGLATLARQLTCWSLGAFEFSLQSHCSQLDEDLKRQGILAVTRRNLLLSNRGFSWKSVSVNGSSNKLRRTGTKHAPKGPL